MSEAQDKLRSISCTQCGGPLQLLGGQRVRSITCGYCGSVLDTRQEYAVVARFQNLKRPLSPISIGMQGKIRDVLFTVIGVVQWQDEDGERWLEHLLFSETHGYAWLEYDHAHFIFSRRVRDVPLIPTVPKRIFTFDGRSFKVFSSYGARVIFVEGELTYLAKVGDRATLTDAIAPPYMLSMEQTAAEEEYLRGEYLQPQTVYAAFGIEKQPVRRHSVHPAQPYVASAFTEGMYKAALVFFPLSLLLLLGAWLLGGGQVIATGRIVAGAPGPSSMSSPFDIENPDSLLRLELYSPSDNGWAFVDVDVVKDNETQLTLAKGISYFSGYEGGESWSEGSKSASAYFKVKEAGRYTLLLRSEGGKGETASNRSAVPVEFKLFKGVTVSRYFLILCIVFAAALFWPLASRGLFEAARWKSEEDDDDDD